MRAVAAADQEDVSDGAALDGVNDFVGMREHRAVRKAGRKHMTAVDAAHAVVVLVSAEGERLLNQRTEILNAVFVRRNVDQTLVTDHRGRVDAIPIAWPLRHQAVCRKQHRRRNVLKFLLLALPCRSEVPGKVGVLFQFRITVRGQHLAMGVDVDAFVLGLL